MPAGLDAPAEIPAKKDLGRCRGTEFVQRKYDRWAKVIS